MSELINTNVFVPTTEGAQKFIDFKGLDYFWSKAKEYVDSQDNEILTAVNSLKADVGDNNSGLIKEVNQLRTEVNALGGAEGGIQGMIDASIEALDLDNKFANADTTASGYADAAKEAAIGHANDLNTAMNTRVEELESKKHEHANKAELDLVKSGDVAKWDETTSRVNTFLDGEGVAETVDTLKDIQAWINGDGVNATELTEAIAAEAKLRGDEDAAINAKIGTVAEDTTVVDMIAAAEEAAVEQANAATAEALKAYYTKEEANAAFDAAGSAATAKSEAIAQAKLDAAEALKAYYTKEEANAAFDAAGSAATAKSEAIADADAKLANKANSADVYTKTEVDGFLQTNSTADQAYAKTYTDELFASITFATENDIDGLFPAPIPA